jgi:hypothetical protein
MNTKNIILTAILFLLVGNVFATDKNIDKKNIDKKACKYVQERIAIIEEFHSLDEGYSIELISASNFLGQISNLKSKSGYSHQTIGKTESNDLVTWKNWFNENKHLLHWDSESKSVIVRL